MRKVFKRAAHGVCGDEEANVFVMRPVRLGPEVNGRYSVVEGLAAGDRIGTEGSFLFRAEYLKTASAKHSH